MANVYRGTGPYQSQQSGMWRTLDTGRVSPYQRLIQATLIRVPIKLPHLDRSGRGHDYILRYHHVN